MVAYDFKPEFVELVRSGRKTQTIRKPREGKSRHARPGEHVQLYENWRQPGAKKIIEDPVCRYVERVLIEWDYSDRDFKQPKVTNGAVDINPYLLAADDGFASAHDFIKFFEDTHGLPFEGVLIKWEPPKEKR